MADEDVQGQVTDDVEGDGDDADGPEPNLQDKLKDALDVKVEDVSGLTKKLTITIPHDTISGQMNDQYNELRRDAVVPGFRRGRAPRRLLEKRFGGDVKDQLTQQMLSVGYMAAIEKTDLKVIGDPMIWAREKDAETDSLVDVQKAIELIELPDDGTLTFSCEVEVRPEFDLPELDGIPVEKPVLSITDEDVDTHIDRLVSRMGSYERVTDGKIEPDDMVVANLKMTSDDTVLKEQEDVRLSARGQSIDGVSLEKLGDDLKGAKVGDVRTSEGQIGDDYVKLEFRGKPAKFEFTVKEIRRLEKPEFNEQFVQSLGFESEKELRDYIRADLESRLDQEIQRGMQGQVRQHLLDKTTFDLPERLSQKQTARVAAQRMIQLYQQGIPAAEVDKLLDEIKASAKQDSARDLKLFFIMEKLGEKFDVDVTEEEMNAQIAQIAASQGSRFDKVRDQLIKEGGAESLFLQLRDEKIVNQLLEKAKVSETEPKAEEGKGGKKPATKKPAAKKAAKKDEGSAKQDAAKADDKPSGTSKKPKRKPPS